jgi:2-oxoglutarate ferredoxin oxidoreductase subunit alpha
MHRIGGLETQDQTGAVSYDPANHEFMIRLRAQKIAGIANDVPLQELEGPETGSVLVLSWGGTYGAVATAVRQLWQDGASVAHAHLRYLNPLPANLGRLVQHFDRVVVAELNAGQLIGLVRRDFLVDAVGLNKITGRPFTVAELVTGIQRELVR